jgi:hypothetical protein
MRAPGSLHGFGRERIQGLVSPTGIARLSGERVISGLRKPWPLAAITSLSRMGNSDDATGISQCISCRVPGRFCRGLHAYMDILRSLPANTGMAFVIVARLRPATSIASCLPSKAQRHCWLWRTNLYRTAPIDRHWRPALGEDARAQGLHNARFGAVAGASCNDLTSINAYNGGSKTPRSLGFKRVQRAPPSWPAASY